jgi:large subunit ribosomal protein L28
MSRPPDDDSQSSTAIGYSWAVARERALSFCTSSFQEYTVAAVCDICAKKPGFGHNRPWSRKITKRRFNPNIQRVRATVNGTPKRMNVCTGCLKAGKVSR